MQQRWPDRLWIVRHGESAGNVARDAAQAAEGDILRRSYPMKTTVVEWDAEHRMWGGFDSQLAIKWEVIGNIYENPDLLK